MGAVRMASTQETKSSRGIPAQDFIENVPEYCKAFGDTQSVISAQQEMYRSSVCDHFPTLLSLVLSQQVQVYGEPDGAASKRGGLEENRDREIAEHAQTAYRTEGCRRGKPANPLPAGELLVRERRHPHHSRLEGVPVAGGECDAGVHIR